MGIFDFLKSGREKKDKQVDTHIKALKHGNLSKRAEAVKALREIRDPRAVEPLIKLLNDPNEKFRVTVAIILGEIGDSRAVKPLISCLNDSSGEVRSFAAGALGNLKAKEAIDPLIKVAMADEDGATRADARITLSKLWPLAKGSTKSSTVRHYDEEWNFSVSYPSEWLILRKSESLGKWAVPIMVGRPFSDGWVSCMVNARRDELIKGSSTMKIVGIGPDGQTEQLPSTPQEFLEITKQDLQKSYSGFKLISAEETRVDNKPAARIIYFRGEGGNEIYEEYTTLFGVGNTFLFICEAPKLESTNYQPTFKEFIEKFRIGRDITESPVALVVETAASSNPVEVYNAGVAHYRNGDFKRAMNAFEQGVNLGEYSLQSTYACALCQKQLGLKVEWPNGFEGDHEAVGPVHVASNIACHILAGGHRAAVTKVAAHSEVEAMIGDSRYLFHVDDLFGQFIVDAWRIENGKEIHITDPSLNPNPTEGDKFILSLIRAGTSLPLAAMPAEGLKGEL